MPSNTNKALLSAEEIKRLEELSDLSAKQRLKVDLKEETKVTLKGRLTVKDEQSGGFSQQEEENQDREKQRQPEQDQENEENQEEDKDKEENPEKEEEEKNKDEKDANPEEKGAGELGAEEGAAAADEAAMSGYGMGAGAGDIGAGLTGATPMAAEGAAAATSAFWGPAAAVAGGIILVLILVLFIYTALVAKCNESMFIRGASKAASWVGIIPADICEVLAINQGGLSGGGGASGEFGVEFVITSAYRPGSVVVGNRSTSAHSRGEAVDLALRPTVPIGSTDPRIAQLVQAAQSVGFARPAGDTLDEYARPTEGATGGHIHLEFNLKSDGTSYCDGTKIPASGPRDLVSLIGVLPVDTASTGDPRVRPCMLDKLINFMAATGATIQPPPNTSNP